MPPLAFDQAYQSDSDCSIVFTFTFKIAQLVKAQANDAGLLRLYNAR